MRRFDRALVVVALVASSFSATALACQAEGPRCAQPSPRPGHPPDPARGASARSRSQRWRAANVPSPPGHQRRRPSPPSRNDRPDGPRPGQRSASGHGSHARHPPPTRSRKGRAASTSSATTDDDGAAHVRATSDRTSGIAYRVSVANADASFAASPLAASPGATRGSASRCTCTRSRTTLPKRSSSRRWSSSPR